MLRRWILIWVHHYVMSDSRKRWLKSWRVSLTNGGFPRNDRGNLFVLYHLENPGLWTQGSFSLSLWLGGRFGSASQPTRAGESLSENKPPTSYRCRGAAVVGVGRREGWWWSPLCSCGWAWWAAHCSCSSLKEAEDNSAVSRCFYSVLSI